MDTIEKTNDSYITVVPYYHHSGGTFGRPIIVSRLYFWHNNTFDHSVNEDTLKFFLSHVEMFGAAIYPDSPELGCSAVNGDLHYEKGETSVWQILYKGDLIYSRC